MCRFQHCKVGEEVRRKETEEAGGKKATEAVSCGGEAGGGQRQEGNKERKKNWQKMEPVHFRQLALSLRSPGVRGEEEDRRGVCVCVCFRQGLWCLCSPSAALRPHLAFPPRCLFSQPSVSFLCFSLQVREGGECRHPQLMRAPGRHSDHSHRITREAKGKSKHCLVYTRELSG